MTKAALFLAPGFEPIESVGAIDVLRRGGVEVTIVAVETNTLLVKGDHGVSITADKTIIEVKNSTFDCLVLPGGMTGASNLCKSDVLVEMLKAHRKTIAAICIAPAMVLKPLGLIDAVKTTGYPAPDPYLLPQRAEGMNVVEDGRFLTAGGPGDALTFGLNIVRILEGTEKANEVAAAMLLDQAMTYPN